MERRFGDGKASRVDDLASICWSLSFSQARQSICFGFDFPFFSVFLFLCFSCDFLFSFVFCYFCLLSLLFSLLFVDEGVSLRLFDPVGLLDVNFFQQKILTAFANPHFLNFLQLAN